jgi:hypothetical protein
MRRTAAFQRPHHQAIARILRRLDGDLLLASRVYFAGGTCLALTFDEYRESRDIDFLVSDRAGFRALREAVRFDSLGAIAREPIELAREVRADRDGIRTFVVDGEAKIKVEFVLEGRIDLSGHRDERLGVPVLDMPLLAAEKLLANADRGMDDSTFGRDLVDLAFLAAHEGRGPVSDGLVIAQAAYGKTVAAEMRRGLARLRARGRLTTCAQALGVDDLPTLRRGLKVLVSMRKG